MKKQVKITLSLLAVVIILAGIFVIHSTTTKKAGAAHNDKNFVLKLADETGGCQAPQQIAIEKGYFKAEGLKVKTVRLTQSTTGLDAVTAGKIDASNSLLASTVAPIANGAPIKITTGLHTGCISILTNKNSKIHSAKDLKGLKIGVETVAGSPATFVKRYLTNAGLKVYGNQPDVQLLAYDAPELPLVLEKGQVDAIAIEDPDTQIAAKKYGFNVLASSAQTAPFNTEYCCVAYVSNSLAKNHPAIAQKYTIALQKAADWVAKHQAETVDIQTKHHYVAGDKAANLEALKTYKWEASYSGAKTAFSQVATSLQKTGGLAKDIDVKALSKNTLLKLKGVD
ncbi:ABC transporter substrate-binding protein [Lactococcus nasutitermitis]|uniref:ABC transporter substrate-binding protein n=1 Tax=Lactococcus nasutitermitis TaxID=1652957 RepID=A0ABV9JDW5_9LACT|nr:ABC transporter substrate-binding protein [Lactococcus nasutitermitis]